MARINVTLDEWLLEALAKEAEHRHASIAEIIRKAAAHYWQTHSSAAAGHSPWFYLREDSPGSLVIYERDHSRGTFANRQDALPASTARMLCTHCLEPIGDRPGNYRVGRDEHTYLCRLCGDMMGLNETMYQDSLASHGAGAHRTK